MADYLPRKNSSLVSWTAAFSRTIAEMPGLGLSAAQVQGYAEAQAAFAAAFAAASNPETRSPKDVYLKNQAARAVESLTRELAAIVRANPAVSQADLLTLGLRKATAERPIDLGAAPRVVKAEIRGESLRVALGDSVSGRVRLPAGCVGAMVFVYPGEAAPGRPWLWRWLGNVTRPQRSLALSEDVSTPGQGVWVTARWLNRRLEAGAWASAVQTWTPMSHGAMRLETMGRAA